MRIEVGKVCVIGVLALQGSVKEHINCIQAADTKAVEVKTAAQLEKIDGLILPGGESTTLGILLHHFNLLHPIREHILQGLPVWGTCAGMILLAKKITDQSVHYLGVMDIVVKRNAFGGQLESFTTEAVIEAVSPLSIPLVFIRAPYIESVHQDVQILATVKNHIVAARQRNMLATSFHPELTNHRGFYDYFMTKMIMKP